MSFVALNAVIRALQAAIKRRDVPVRALRAHFLLYFSVILVDLNAVALLALINILLAAERAGAVYI
jgi:hypothetical protein